MGQMSFFDVENRYAALDAKHDPLVKINAVVPWEALRSRLENVWRKPPDKRKSNAGCKPWDALIESAMAPVGERHHRANRRSFSVAMTRQCHSHQLCPPVSHFSRRPIVYR